MRSFRPVLTTSGSTSAMILALSPPPPIPLSICQDTLVWGRSASLKLSPENPAKTQPKFFRLHYNSFVQRDYFQSVSTFVGSLASQGAWRTPGAAGTVETDASNTTQRRVNCSQLRLDFLLSGFQMADLSIQSVYSALCSTQFDLSIMN